MRDIDRALIRAFRPSLNADEVDCVQSGSCFIISAGTVPTLVFMSVDMYIPLEPTQQRIVQIETALKRPFRLDAADVEVVGVTPTLYGTDAAGIENCVVTYGTDWADIESNCLAATHWPWPEFLPSVDMSACTSTLVAWSCSGAVGSGCRRDPSDRAGTPGRRPDR